MEKIKEKIGLYKTLIALSWTAFVITVGGAYKLHHTHELKLLYLAISCAILLATAVISLIFRTRFWINKMEK